ncbi:hypothetical protein BGZ49_002943 [Haplosporangium sp. Z 27]|nr:hypothetical protein BGZ49_002943 [Haplosporangium sp. Z 27]
MVETSKTFKDHSLCALATIKSLAGSNKIGDIFKEAELFKSTIRDSTERVTVGLKTNFNGEYRSFRFDYDEEGWHINAIKGGQRYAYYREPFEKSLGEEDKSFFLRTINVIDNLNTCDEIINYLVLMAQGKITRPHPKY